MVPGVTGTSHEEMGVEKSGWSTGLVSRRDGGHRTTRDKTEDLRKWREDWKEK